MSCARPDDPALLGALAGADVGDDPWPTVTVWLREHTGADLAERAELPESLPGRCAASRRRRPPSRSRLRPVR